MKINDNDEYRDYLEKLKIEFGHFIRISQSCDNLSKSLTVRKTSVQLRKMLKEFRRIILKRDKIVKESRNKHD